jgi:Predicted signal-transduction protein containing cAMP-binding and CBS domains
MDDIFVGSLMTSPVTTVSPDTSADDAAAMMLEEGISSVVVVDDSDELAGILTSTDFVAIAAADHSAESVSAADYMTTDVVTTTVNESIQDVADRFIEHGIHHVPVVSGNGVVGMVTTTDLTAYLSGSIDSDFGRAWT